MNEILVILKKDIRETVRSKTFILTIGAAIVVLFFLTNVTRDNVTAILEQGVTANELTGYVQPIVGGSLFTTAIIIAIYFSYCINSYTLLVEKTKRSLESLLCTPLSLRQFLFGKTLAMFVPSTILSLILTIVTFCVINIFIISPKLGYWIYPGIAPIITILICIPPIVLFLSALFHMLQLMISNVRLITVIFMIILVGTINGLVFSLRLSASSWPVVYISLGIAAVIALVDYFLYRVLTKEKIILSSKS
jgi:ABC-2 type transport system permease protein